MHDPSEDRPAKARDFIRIYEIVPAIPGLPLPFTGPDRAAFYLIDGSPGDQRENIDAARDIFAAAFRVTFGWHDEQGSNGMRRLYTARLESGLAIVLYAVAENMRDQDVAVRELAEVA